MANNLTDYDKILEEQRKKLADTKKTQQDAINKTYDSQVTILKDQYGQVIDDTNVAYESEYQKNAVQKLINEKKIAEKNANLGLTDSGLNRTQQTAAQLSYANQKGNIDIAKRNALDTLSQNLASSLASIEQSRVTSLANLDTSIESQAQSNAYDIYKTNVEANTAVQKAAIEAKPLNVWTYTGTNDDNGYVAFMNSEGKTQLFKKGVNPYTGTVNIDINEGTFKNGNGYQPNNIKGKKLTQMEGYEAVNDLGETLKVWTIDGGETLYVWDALRNRYEDVTDQKEKLKKIK